MIRCLAAAALLALTAMPASAQNYIGRWAASPSDCRKPQTAEFPPAIFRRNGYDRRDTHCAFSAMSKDADGWWTTQARCVIAGATVTKPLKIRVDGNVLSMTDGKDDWMFERCR